MPKKFRSLLLGVSLLLLAACSPKENAHRDAPASPIADPGELKGPQTTTLLDIDNGTRIVLTIDGWHDYRPGDIISAQGGSGSGNWEIVRGWFIVHPSTKQPGHWAPSLTRMYHARALQGELSVPVTRPRG